MFHLTIPEFVVICVGGMFVISLILFPSWREKVFSLASGFLHVLMQNVAETPEGADAIYAQKIDEAQEKYNQVVEQLRSMAGQLKSVQDEYSKCQESAMEWESKAKAALSKNDEESARTFARNAREMKIMMQSLNRQYDEMQPGVEEVKRAKEYWENEIANLKVTRTKVVSEMKANKQIQDMYSSLDDLNARTGTDKLIDATQEGLKSSREKTAGARIVYQSSRKGKLEKANAKSADYELDSYLDSLRKGNSKPITYDIKDPNAFSKSSGLNTQSKK